MSWSKYLYELERCAPRHNVKNLLEDPGDSWLMTLDDLKAIVRKPLARMSKDEFNKLVGRGCYGWFGSVTAKGTGVTQLRENRSLQGTVTRLLPAVVRSRTPSEALVYAKRLFLQMVRYKNIGSAAVTRFLTLARPDLFFSVSGRSVKRLQILLQIPQSRLKSWHGYAEALQLVWRSKWYRSSRPNRSSAARAWKARVALLDVWAYTEP